MLLGRIRTANPSPILRRHVVPAAATSSPSCWMSTAMTAKPNFAEGSDTAALTEKLSPLLSGSGGRWALTADGQGVERSFKFKTFAKTWDFMTAVSLQCKIKNHHPEWSNVYNTTFIRWTTHSPKGLSSRDIDLAAICDALAKDFGETAESADAGQACAMQNLTDQVTSASGDCCTPKKKAT